MTRHTSRLSQQRQLTKSEASHTTLHATVPPSTFPHNRLCVHGSAVSDETLDEYGLVDDCQVFPDLLQYCRLIGGSSVLAAVELLQRRTRLALNLTGFTSKLL